MISRLWWKPVYKRFDWSRGELQGIRRVLIWLPIGMIVIGVIGESTGLVSSTIFEFLVLPACYIAGFASSILLGATWADIGFKNLVETATSIWMVACLVPSSALQFFRYRSGLVFEFTLLAVLTLCGILLRGMLGEQLNHYHRSIATALAYGLVSVPAQRIFFGACLPFLLRRSGTFFSWRLHHRTNLEVASLVREFLIANMAALLFVFMHVPFIRQGIFGPLTIIAMYFLQILWAVDVQTTGNLGRSIIGHWIAGCTALYLDISSL